MINNLKDETIKFINGFSCLHPILIEGLKSLMCNRLELNRTDETDRLIDEAVSSYFNSIKSHKSHHNNKESDLDLLQKFPSLGVRESDTKSFRSTLLNLK